MLPVSNDTLLRVVRRRGSPRFVPPTVIGIDDWAWRRNQRYGTIICDLERRKTIALLPDASRRQPRLGCPISLRSISLPVTAAAPMRLPRPRRYRRPPRWPTGGT